MAKAIKTCDEKKNFWSFSGSRFFRMLVIISLYFARVISECRLSLLLPLLLIHNALAVDVLPSFPLAIRTGRQNCWVKTAIENGEICISKDLWLRDFTATGSWEGRWSLSSSPDNDGSPKKIFRTFHALKKTSSPEKTFYSQICSLVEKRREETSQILNDSFPDRFGIFKRLLLNESGPHDFSSFFRVVGFVHLFSASGIHLYALSFCLGWLVSAIGSRLLIPISIALPIARILSSALWCWGWALTGCKLSMLRPLLLIGIRRSASIMGFRWRVWAPLALSIFLDIGFSIFVSKNDWIQGAAFYALAIAGGALAEGHILVCLSSWIFLAIWEALKIAHISLLTPILSLLTLTVTTLLVYPILIASSLVGGFPLSTQISWAFDFFIGILLKISLFTGNLWIVQPRQVILAIFIVSFCSLLKSKFRNTLLVVSAFALITLRFFSHPSEVIQIDVGQGDGALYAGRTTGMIDTGSKRSLSDVDWIEFFARKGIDKISWIGLTHLDEDHSGGALRLARLLPVGCVATSDNELLSPRGLIYEDHLKSMGVEVDHSLQACIPIPSYEPPEQAPSAHVANENMCAFLVPFKNGFWLSAGDATEKDELKIGAWAKQEIEKLHLSEDAFRILKISHHGSKTSSNPEFIQMIKPTEAWISDGVGNHYGHPAPSVLEELRQFGIPIERTDEKGELREADVHRRQ
jgi:competence protein ComEC